VRRSILTVRCRVCKLRRTFHSWRDLCETRFRLVLSIPKECHNPSRWLSEATPPVLSWPRSDPGQGSHRGVTPDRGAFHRRIVSGGVARCGLNHRLGLSQTSGLHTAKGTLQRSLRGFGRIDPPLSSTVTLSSHRPVSFDLGGEDKIRAITYLLGVHPRRVLSLSQ
jgi:hypothetical protein